MSSELAGKHRRTAALLFVDRALAILAVIASGVFEEPLRRAVIVFVHDVGWCALAKLGPGQRPGFVVDAGARAADQLDLGILGANDLREYFVALEIDLAPLFVTDAEVFEIEGRGVAHRRSL